MKNLSYFSGILLFALLFFGWGIAAGAYKFWPWQYLSKIQELHDFVVGHPAEPSTSPFEKMESDLGGIPYRYLIKDVENLLLQQESTAFSIKQQGINIEGFHTNTLANGYFLITGAFNFGNGSNLALLLISSKGEFIKYWTLSSTGVGIALDEARQAVLLTKDLQKVDWCSDGTRRAKNLYKGMHHSVEVAPDGTYWTHEDEAFIQLDPDTLENGNLKLLRKIDILKDLIPLNKEISPLSPRLTMDWNSETDSQKLKPIIGLLEDPFHNNDVQPFVDERFPTSLGYALALSIREPNLLMVIDPETKKVLWFKQGLTERQHDIDYYEGDFYIYDNGSFRGYSSIVKIPIESSLTSFQGETIINGSKFDWLDPSRGQHQVFKQHDKNYYLLINDRRGRLYVFNENEEPVFAIQNYLEKEQESSTILQLRNALYITEEQFNNLEQACGVE